MAENGLTIRSEVVASTEQVWCDLADEVVVLSLSDGCYYGLSRVAAAVWHRIQEPRTVAEVTEGLLEKYDVSAKRCADDVLELLEDLCARGLVVASGVGNGAPTATTSTGDGARVGCN